MLHAKSLTPAAIVFLAVLGTATFAAPPLAAPLEPRPEIQTHLYTLERAVVSLGKGLDASNTGAIDSLGNDLLLVRPKGAIALIRPNGDVEYLAGEVPTNASALVQTLPDDDAHWRALHDFRVADVLLNELSTSRFDLYVTHHYFDGECVRFRLSSTVIVRVKAIKNKQSRYLHPEKITVRPQWRTIFDAGLCLSPRWLPLHQAGGKMLMDGPEHLLVIIGDHGKVSKSNAMAQPARPASSPVDSPLGTFLRVTIATGETETLTRGHRNPQGLARDAAGNLWASEHGPRGGDELNLLKPGRDYGWPAVSYGIDYPGRSGGPGGSIPPWMGVETVGRHDGDGFTAPVFAWVPSIAPTSIVPNDEERFPMWSGDLLIGSLRATSIFRVRLFGQRIQYVERMVIGVRIRDMAWLPDGRLALLHDPSLAVSFLQRSDQYRDAADPRGGGVYAVHCEY